MIRLGSYNIRKAVGLDWRRDPARILRVLAQLDAQIVAVQEADKRFGVRLPVLPEADIFRTAGLRLVSPGHDGPSSGWHGNALLVGPAWDIVRTQRLVLPGIEPRGALIADLQGPDGPLTIVATHLGLRRACRQLQLAHILKAIGLRHPRSVLMGDLNEWSREVGFDIIAHAFDVISPGRSFHAARPMAALDRFALGSAVSLQQAGVLTKGEARRASDHLPVWADVDLAALP